MITLLGVLGTNEMVILGVIFIGFIFLPILCYSLGKKAGYRKGQLDMYKEREKRETL